MIKRALFSLLAIFMIAGSAFAAKPIEGSMHTSDYKIKSGKIVFDAPKPAKGQQTMVGFAAEPIEVVRVGVIGLGMRGPGAIHRLTQIENVEIKAICDLYEDRVKGTQELLKKNGQAPAAEYTGEDGWIDLCNRDDLDLIYIVTPWDSHTKMAVYAMEHGKHVAIEVPAAQSVDECWALVDTSERTRKHCMMLENCVYDFFELTTLNMAQEGLFGEIIHAEGAYIHNLEPFWDAYQGDWRLDFNQKHAGDIYATHGIGPVCLAMDIHRGDKLNTLVSVSTKSVNGKAIYRKKHNDPDAEFLNGDQTSTLLTTEDGNTILIQHNVMTPRPYDRLYKLVGTTGYANKYPVTGLTFADKDVMKKMNHEDLDSHGFVPKEVEKDIMNKYKHPILVEIEEKAKKVGGHGGMDFIMDYRLIYCLQNGLPLDQDVYDAAEWSAFGELTAASIANGSMPVEFPDFTRGHWQDLDGYKMAE